MQIFILCVVVAMVYIMALILYSIPRLFGKINNYYYELERINETKNDKYYCDDKTIDFVKDLFDGIKNISIGVGFLVGTSISKGFGVNGIILGLLSIIGAILIYLPFFVWSLKIIKAYDLRNHEKKSMPAIVVFGVGSISVLFFIIYNMVRFY